jgi:hypothetical protein
MNPRVTDPLSETYKSGMQDLFQLEEVGGCSAGLYKEGVRGDIGLVFRLGVPKHLCRAACVVLQVKEGTPRRSSVCAQLKRRGGRGCLEQQRENEQGEDTMTRDKSVRHSLTSINSMWDSNSWKALAASDDRTYT